MNKRLFYYLFAVLCTVTLFTSCSDDDGDDTPTVIPIEQEMAGDYKGTMDVYYVGVPDPIASGLSSPSSSLQDVNNVTVHNTETDNKIISCSFLNSLFN